jgi:hypothetical protein
MDNHNRQSEREGIPLEGIDEFESCADDQSNL